ncbi:MAG: hypothetical protein KGV56_02475 [Gammaproteobacteria bacterium]|nr:hypothetical protein [Gammaproteobacteria bacterium]
MTINIDEIPNTDDDVIHVSRRETLIRVTPTGGDELLQKIAELKALLPVHDNQVEGDTDYLANYLLERGTL